MGRLEPHQDVLGHRQVRAERQLLVDQGDAGVARGQRRHRGVGRAVDLHRAAVGRQGAGDHVEQRALAGAVLADQRVHLAGREVHVDAVERHRRAEALAKSREDQH